jgi:prepilin-type N-terminal cleavage/methylation domain-containing protein
MTKAVQRYRRKAFTLAETLAALALVAIVSSGIMMVTIRSSHTMINCLAQLRALEVADEQMQQLLAKASVKEGIEYGRSARYPDIQWQTKIDIFDEPVTGTTWVRAFCSSTYTDANGQPQVIELTSLVSRLTDQQLALLRQSQEQQTLVGIEAAARYAGVTTDTIKQWIQNGLLVGVDGTFLKQNLDIFVTTGGNPTDQQKAQQVQPPTSIRPQEGLPGELPDGQIR